jgi:hypothetical protein
VAASVYSRAIQKAAELLGGRERLAKVLFVPVAEIEKWIADKARPPREVFLRVVDIVLDEGAPSGDSESREPPPEQDCAGGAARSPET